MSRSADHIPTDITPGEIGAQCPACYAHLRRREAAVTEHIIETTGGSTSYKGPIRFRVVPVGGYFTCNDNWYYKINERQAMLCVCVVTFNPDLVVNED